MKQCMKLNKSTSSVLYLDVQIFNILGAMKFLWKIIKNASGGWRKQQQQQLTGGERVNYIEHFICIVNIFHWDFHNDFWDYLIFTQDTCNADYNLAIAGSYLQKQKNKLFKIFLLFFFSLFLSLHRLLIGAPKARALSNQGANITGGLYSCDITSHPNDCTRVDFDNDGKQENHLCTRDLTISYETSGVCSWCLLTAVVNIILVVSMLNLWQCQDSLIDLEFLLWLGFCSRWLSQLMFVWRIRRTNGWV